MVYIDSRPNCLLILPGDEALVVATRFPLGSGALEGGCGLQFPSLALDRSVGVRPREGMTTRTIELFFSGSCGFLFC